MFVQMFLRMAAVVMFVTSAACAKGAHDMVYLHDAGDDDRGGDDDDSNIDADRHPPDDTSRNVPAQKLLLTEIVLAPSAGELIEIMNPNVADVDLGDYYISDSAGYFRLPTGVPAVDAGDFIARFPSTTIHGKEVMTIAIADAAGFTTTYPGHDPTFSIGTGDHKLNVLNVNGTATLTNDGEMIALFHWDGQSDLVQDVDLMIAGKPSAANNLVTKAGVQQDGPDSDNVTSAYAAEALTIAAQASTPGSGASTKRVQLEAGNQAPNGNGVGGDETSENTAVTWDSTGFSAPTPGDVPATLQ